MARVRLIEVSKRFGDTVALDRVSFEVEDGEFFTLLGPSGCGKTTTLRIIAGLEVPDEGEVYIDDTLVNYVHPKDRNIGMVFQNYALYPHMTVFENIAFPLLVRRKELGLDKEEIRRRVVEVAKLLKIEELLDRYPRQLSGGQQQRVALARTLVRKPKVWLLDEPLSNLDAKLRLYMRSELKRLQRELGITTIYVTHDQVEAMSMADRIAIMNKGRVLQIGRPEDLYNRPSDTFVATFIGSPPMNLIPCEYVEEAGSRLLRCPGFTHTLDPEIAKALEGRSEVLLGVRPEHIRISKERGPGWVEATTLISEPLGVEHIVAVDLGGVTVRIRAPPEFRPEIGEKVYLQIDWSRILLFDKNTGKALV